MLGLIDAGSLTVGTCFPSSLQDGGHQQTLSFTEGLGGVRKGCDCEEKCEGKDRGGSNFRRIHTVMVRL